eukprot:Skav227734  [mRNA]  locus=scaffold3513:61064:68608:+ [translate_table: standard]
MESGYAAGYARRAQLGGDSARSNVARRRRPGDELGSQGGLETRGLRLEQALADQRSVKQKLSSALGGEGTAMPAAPTSEVQELGQRLDERLHATRERFEEDEGIDTDD